jgi:hypothetical protein
LIIAIIISIGLARFRHYATFISFRQPFRRIFFITLLILMHLQDILATLTMAGLRHYYASAIS